MGAIKRRLEKNSYLELHYLHTPCRILLLGLSKWRWAFDSQGVK
jgi:hypothetical protein